MRHWHEDTFHIFLKYSSKSRHDLGQQGYGTMKSWTLCANARLGTPEDSVHLSAPAWLRGPPLLSSGGPESSLSVSFSAVPLCQPVWVWYSPRPWELLLEPDGHASGSVEVALRPGDLPRTWNRSKKIHTPFRFFFFNMWLDLYGTHSNWTALPALNQRHIVIASVSGELKCQTNVRLTNSSHSSQRHTAVLHGVPCVRVAGWSPRHAGGPWGWPRPAPVCPAYAAEGRAHWSCFAGCAGHPAPAAVPRPVHTDRSTVHYTATSLRLGN